MAVSIDNVYQKVLALANKEQRGYVTPQEFNLLADKAQNDIFEMYFHEYQTALAGIGQQSKTADDVDMLREKIAAHREHGIAVTAAGVIPSDVHWLESVYDVQDIRTIELTVGDGSTITDDLLSVSLFAIYDGTGLVGEGEGPYNIYFTVDSLGTLENILPGKLVIMITTTEATAADVAGKVIEALNDSSPYHSAALKPGETNVITITYKQPGITGLTGEAAYASGWSVATVSSVIDPVVYEEIDKDDWVYIKSNKKLNPSKANRGIFYRKDATTLGVLPDPGRAIQCDYIKKPTKPNWGYVVVNDKALYNSNTSTDFDLHASEESTLTNKILELAGIVINKPGLSEVILRNEAVKEANENR